MFLTGLNFARPQLVACFGLFLTKDLRHRRKSGCRRNKAVLAFSLKASEMWDSLVEEHQWVMEVVVGLVLQQAPLEFSKELSSRTVWNRCQEGTSGPRGSSHLHMHSLWSR